MKTILAIIALTSIATTAAIKSGVDMGKKVMVPPHVKYELIEAVGERTTQSLIETGCALELTNASVTGTWNDNYCYRTYNHLLEKL